MEKTTFDYFYSNENENFLFLQVPLPLMIDARFKNLSDGSKLLYGLLLRRTELSRKNNWKDEQNRIYIIYTIAEMMEDLNRCEQKVLKCMNELKTIGLVKTIRQGLTKPNIIYVMNFSTELKYNRPQNKPETGDNTQNNDLHGSATLKDTVREQRVTGSIYTHSNKNNFKNTDVSIYPTEVEIPAPENPPKLFLIDTIDTKETVTQRPSPKGEGLIVGGLNRRLKPSD